MCADNVAAILFLFDTFQCAESLAYAHTIFGMVAPLKVTQVSCQLYGQWCIKLGDLVELVTPHVDKFGRNGIKLSAVPVLHVVY